MFSAAVSKNVGLNHVAQQLCEFISRISNFSIVSVLPLTNPGNHEQPVGLSKQRNTTSNTIQMRNNNRNRDDNQVTHI
jgi:hypothetical protein